MDHARGGGPRWDTLWLQTEARHARLGPSLRHKMRWLRRIQRRYRLGGRVLEVGVGDGTPLSLFADGTNLLFGMDLSEEALKLASERCPAATCFRGDITRADTLPGEPFDVVICSNVLEEIEADALALRNMASLLRPGGHLVLITQHRAGYWSRYDEAAGNVRRYEIGDLVSKVKGAGLETLWVRTWGFPLYALHYRHLLSRVDPGREWEARPARTRLLGSLAYLVLHLDDLFMGLGRGRLLLVVARRPVRAR